MVVPSIDSRFLNCVKFQGLDENKNTDLFKKLDLKEVKAEFKKTNPGNDNLIIDISMIFDEIFKKNNVFATGKFRPVIRNAVRRPVSTVEKSVKGSVEESVKDTEDCCSCGVISSLVAGLFGSGHTDTVVGAAGEEVEKPGMRS